MDLGDYAQAKLWGNNVDGDGQWIWAKAGQSDREVKKDELIPAAAVIFKVALFSIFFLNNGSSEYVYMLSEFVLEHLTGKELDSSWWRKQNKSECWTYIHQVDRHNSKLLAP